MKVIDQYCEATRIFKDLVRLTVHLWLINKDKFKIPSPDLLKNISNTVIIINLWKYFRWWMCYFGTWCNCFWFWFGIKWWWNKMENDLWFWIIYAIFTSLIAIPKSIVPQFNTIIQISWFNNVKIRDMIFCKNIKILFESKMNKNNSNIVVQEKMQFAINLNFTITPKIILDLTHIALY